MNRSQVAMYKSVYTVLLGLIVTPVFVWRAFADRPPSVARAA